VNILNLILNPEKLLRHPRHILHCEVILLERRWIYAIIVVVIIIVAVAGYYAAYPPKASNTTVSNSNQSSSGGNSGKSGISYQILPVLKTVGPPG
jgi:hypothetical protein